jgi:hypothetical protein
MQGRTLTALCVFALAGCGGSGDNDPGAGTAYAFVPPVVNSVRSYSETLVDNANNTILIGYTQTVLAVAADGTITEMQQSTTGSSSIVNGTNYAALTETETYDGKSGQETSYLYTAASGAAVTCTYDPRDVRLGIRGRLRPDRQRRRPRIGDRTRRYLQRTEVAKHGDVDEFAGNHADTDRYQLARCRHVSFSQGKHHHRGQWHAAVDGLCGQPRDRAREYFVVGPRCQERKWAVKSYFLQKPPNRR